MTTLAATAVSEPIAPPSSPVFTRVCPNINWLSRTYGSRRGDTYTILRINWENPYASNFLTSRATEFTTEEELIDFILLYWSSNEELETDQFGGDDDLIKFRFSVSKLLGRKVDKMTEELYAEITQKAKVNPKAFFRQLRDSSDIVFVKEGMDDPSLERYLEKVSDILLDIEEDSDDDY